jgi:AbiJ N-terminal domain 4
MQAGISRCPGSVPETLSYDQENGNMPIVDLFSSREKKDRPSGDVWEYDNIPPALRVQVSNIVRDALGPVRDYGDSSGPVYTTIRDTVAHEHGRAQLAETHGGSGHHRARNQVHTCIQTELDLLVWLDTVELSFRAIEMYFGRLDNHGREFREIKLSAEKAVGELNERFRRAGFGYRYERGKIIRSDSELLHQEVTLPALKLLSDQRFAGADQEFRAAHDHLKTGEYKDCAVDALNALESTMKAICDAKDWKYDKSARASDLVKVLRREGLFPEFADHRNVKVRPAGRTKRIRWSRARCDAGRRARVCRGLCVEPCGIKNPATL